MLSEQVVEALEDNRIPWHRTGITGVPRNSTSKKYSGPDILLFVLSGTGSSCEKVDFTLAHNVLHKVPAKVVYNKDAEAFYSFPPEDYITLPCLEDFEKGIGGPEAYYETLAHELVHWTEPRLGFDCDGYQKPEAVRELRAELGAAFLMMELKVPNSIMYRNFAQYRKEWIRIIKKKPAIIFNIANSAIDAVDCILAHSGLREER